MRPAITCAGIAVCDVIVRTVRHPLPLGLLQLVDDLTLTDGGCALRTAKALGGMRIDTSLIAPVGPDMFGNVLRASISDDPVDVHWIEVDEPTSSSAILVDETGERTIFHQIGANRALTADHIEERLKGEILHVGGALVLPSLDGTPLANLLAHAQGQGMRTSVDVVYDAANRWELINPSLQFLDLFCPSLAEAEAITGRTKPSDAAAELRERGVKTVLVTDGAEGCWLDSDEHRGHIPAIPVETIDSTGAGDAFTAGALIGLAYDLTPFESAQMASALGALATTTSATFSGLEQPDHAWRLAGLEIPTE